MTPDKFRKAGKRLYLAHHGVECPADVQLFKFLAAQLDSDPRTISRWVYGERGISGPVKIALESLLRLA